SVAHQALRYEPCDVPRDPRLSASPRVISRALNSNIIHLQPRRVGDRQPTKDVLRTRIPLILLISAPQPDVGRACKVSDSNMIKGQTIATITPKHTRRADRPRDILSADFNCFIRRSKECDSLNCYVRTEPELQQLRPLTQPFARRGVAKGVWGRAT